MKELILRMWTEIKKLVMAFTPSLITVGVTIAAISYFKFWPTNQIIQQAKTDTISLDVISQVSEKAIHASNNAVEMMKWVVVTFLGFTISAATYLGKTEKDISQKVTKIQQEYSLVSKTLDKTENQLNDLSTRYLNLQQDLYDLPSQILPYEMAIAAFEDGKIQEKQLFECQAWFSWQKWIFADDPTGYEELLIHKESREGLPVSIVRAAITVLTKLLEKKKRLGAFNTRDQDKMTKLISLLNFETKTEYWYV